MTKLATFKSYAKKSGEVEHKWVLVDATDMTLGRLATFVATRLTGKYQPSFTAHMDSGDNVVVINAEKIVFNGNEITKKYYRHSGYVGNLHEKSAKEMTRSEMLEKAVKGMHPKNKLQSPRMARLRINAGEAHENAAQTPEKVEVK